MENIKEAFSRVKQDIFSLGAELSGLRLELQELKSEIQLISSFIDNIKQKQIQENPQNDEFLTMKNEIYSLKHQINTKLLDLDSIISQHTLQQTNKPTDKPTHPLLNSNTSNFPTHNPTHPQEIGGLKSPNLVVSTGNQGVPTDKPTNQQTNQHIIQHTNVDGKKESENQLDRASEILASLDNLKKEVRLKFKRLTSQEMQVFSILYSLEEQGNLVDYKLISEKMSLSESSIRDYIGKIQKKGIPITKEKLNNKQVILHISQDLKKIASLNTILKLREL